MKLLIVSGLSGSGKSIALATLEDCGYYCIDNLPVALLPRLAESVAPLDPALYEKCAVAIDARNSSANLTAFPSYLSELKAAGVVCEVLFLQADDDVLLKRYSETRRRHPLTSGNHSLAEAIALDKALLQPVARCADLFIDTSRTTMHQLRGQLRARVVDKAHATLSLSFESFGYKHGLPLDSDFVFDARCLPNPYWEIGLRELSGRDLAVIEFLASSPEVRAYLDDLTQLLGRWIPQFQAENRCYLTIAFGCTGGQHRSVYLAETLGNYFRRHHYQVLVRHRELDG